MLDTDKEGPHTVTYKFTTSEEGKYKIWVSTTPAQVNWSSHFTVKLNGVEAGLKSGQDMAMAPYGNALNPNLLTWRLVANDRLEPGEHTLIFEVNDKRELGESYAFSLDAILVTNTGVKPNAATKPAEVAVEK
jgi:hypothetical protein